MQSAPETDNSCRVVKMAVSSPRQDLETWQRCRWATEATASDREFDTNPGCHEINVTVPPRGRGMVGTIAACLVADRLSYHPRRLRASHVAPRTRDVTCCMFCFNLNRSRFRRVDHRAIVTTCFDRPHDQSHQIHVQTARDRRPVAVPREASTARHGRSGTDIHPAPAGSAWQPPGRTPRWHTPWRHRPVDGHDVMGTRPALINFATCVTYMAAAINLLNADDRRPFYALLRNCVRLMTLICRHFMSSRLSRRSFHRNCYKNFTNSM